MNALKSFMNVGTRKVLHACVLFTLFLHQEIFACKYFWSKGNNEELIPILVKCQNELTTFTVFPKKIFDIVLSYMDTEDLLLFRRACKDFKAVLKSFVLQNPQMVQSKLFVVVCFDDYDTDEFIGHIKRAAACMSDKGIEAFLDESNTYFQMNKSSFEVVSQDVFEQLGSDKCPNFISKSLVKFTNRVPFFRNVGPSVACLFGEGFVPFIGMIVGSSFLKGIPLILLISTCSTLCVPCWGLAILLFFALPSEFDTKRPSF